MSSTGSAEPAWLELSGEVVPLAELEAPLSGLPCVLYQVALGLLQRFRDGGGAHRETAGLDFLIRTSADQLVLIEPQQACLRLAAGLRGRLLPGLDPARDLRLQALYRRLDRRPPRGALSAGERLLQAGEQVAVQGWALEQPHPLGRPGGYRLPPRLPVLRAARLLGRAW